MSRADQWEQARRVFRRDTAKQAWWSILVTLFATLVAGLFFDVGADRLAKFGPVLATMMVAPVSIVLGYLGVSAWENKLTSPDQERINYDYGPSTRAYDPEYSSGA